MLRSSYSFRSEEASMLLFDSIGWELMSPAYSFDGQNRTETHNVIFQYTLSGEGPIEVDGAIHRLTKGKAFLVTSQYTQILLSGRRYRALGSSMAQCTGPFSDFTMESTTAHCRPIIQLPQESPPFRLLWSISQDIQVHEERNLHPFTAKTFQWILSMDNFMKRPHILTDHIKNDKLHAAIQFMKDDLHTNLSLDDVADHVGVSKHHLCRLFQKNINLSPFEYLRRRRIELLLLSLKQQI